MSSTTKGFAYRDLTYHGRPEFGRSTVNFAKTLPASTTGNLFAVTGSILVTGLVGVVSTALQASNVSPTLGVTGLPAAIAAAPASPFNATALGSVIVMPLTPGGALPAPVVASGAITLANRFEVTAANITITTATTVTGAITWLLSWVPLMPKIAATVAAV